MTRMTPRAQALATLIGAELYTLIIHDPDNFMDETLEEHYDCMGDFVEAFYAMLWGRDNSKTLAMLNASRPENAAEWTAEEIYTLLRQHEHMIRRAIAEGFNIGLRSIANGFHTNAEKYIHDNDWVQGEYK